MCPGRIAIAPTPEAVLMFCGGLPFSGCGLGRILGVGRRPAPKSSTTPERIHRNGSYLYWGQPRLTCAPPGAVVVVTEPDTVAGPKPVESGPAFVNVIVSPEAVPVTLPVAVTVDPLIAQAAPL